MKTVTKICFAMLIAVALVGSSFAQTVDFQEEIRRLAEDNARGYIGPFATAFGTSMNSGLYHTARPHSILGFDISVKVTAMQIAEEDLTYDYVFPRVPFEVTNPSTNQMDTIVIRLGDFYPEKKTSTVFGDNPANTMNPDHSGIDDVITGYLENLGWDAATIAQFRSQPEYNDLVNELTSNIPAITSIPGIGLDAFGLVMPQVSLGLPFKTEVMLRYAPEVEVGDFGKIKFMGIGVKHSLSQYIPIPMFPVDISGQYVWQKLEIGDLIESTHTAMNLQASKRLGFMLLSITPYVGFGVESSDLNISYTIEGTGDPLLDGTPINFDLEGENKSRLTAGARLGLAFLTIDASYSLGAYEIVNLGVGISIR